MFLKIIVLCVTYVQCANILGMFPFPSYSHQIVYQPIWRELSLRGHKVTVVTPDPLNDLLLTNLTEISIRNVYEIWKKKTIQDILSKDGNVFFNLDFLYRFDDAILEEVFSDKKFQELIWDKNKTFDLVLLECFSPAIYTIAERFRAPIIVVCSSIAVTIIYDILGNPHHPILCPDNFLSFQNQRLSLWEKTVTVLFSTWSRYYHHNHAKPRSQKIAETFFGKNMLYLGEIEKNISMAFTNVIPFIYPQRALSIVMLDLHHLHLKPLKPLAQNLQKVLDKAEEGVVYFSLGTNIKSEQLGETLTIIIEALSELPYTVIWKYESDHLPNKPSNVVIQKWLPQQDILAHPNIRVFVTQGGLQSIAESIFNAVPMVGLPFIGDQPMNIRKIVDLGIGVSLDPVTVTKDELKKSIIEVAENKLYKENIQKIRNRTFDKQIKSVEEAVWWSEYVIRHKGARHLKTPSATMSWFDYLLLDVIILVIITLTVIIIMTKITYKLAKLGFKNIK